jgi:hypothetical protein
MQLTKEEFEQLSIGLLAYLMLAIIGFGWNFLTDGLLWSVLTDPAPLTLWVALATGFYGICLFGATILTFGTLIVVWLRTFTTIVEE